MLSIKNSNYWVFEGHSSPIGVETLREAQISLCQHAPAITKGIEGLPDLKTQWFEVAEEIRFIEPEELLIGTSHPFPHYRELVAHLDGINRKNQKGSPVPTIFQHDCDIVTAVQLPSGVQWLDMAVTDGFVSFTCLPETTRKLEPGRILLFAA